MIIPFVAAQKTHAILVIQVSSQGRPRQSRVLVFLLLPKVSPLVWLWSSCMRTIRAILAQPAKNRLARPTRNPPVNRWA